MKKKQTENKLCYVKISFTNAETFTTKSTERIFDSKEEAYSGTLDFFKTRKDVQDIIKDNLDYFKTFEVKAGKAYCLHIDLLEELGGSIEITVSRNVKL